MLSRHGERFAWVVKREKLVRLLCRWLGPKSSRQATSLRTANCHDESVAVKKIWERLDNRYGAPELMLLAVQDRLERFPRLTPKDNIKLYELADLVSEIDCLKGNDMYRPSLAHFDSAAGVNPIIDKLLAFMQNKWTDVAIRYKTVHQVMYPPFGQVAAFLMKMAERSNDPSFKPYAVSKGSCRER